MSLVICQFTFGGFQAYSLIVDLYVKTNLILYFIETQRQPCVVDHYLRKLFMVGCGLVYKFGVSVSEKNMKSWNVGSNLDSTFTSTLPGIDGYNNVL